MASSLASHCSRSMRLAPLPGYPVTMSTHTCAHSKAADCRYLDCRYPCMESARAHKCAACASCLPAWLPAYAQLCALSSASLGPWPEHMRHIASQGELRAMLCDQTETCGVEQGASKRRNGAPSSASGAGYAEGVQAARSLSSSVGINPSRIIVLPCFDKRRCRPALAPSAPVLPSASA